MITNMQMASDATRQRPQARSLGAPSPFVSAVWMVEVSALTPEERARYDGFQDWLCRERRGARAKRGAEKIPGLKAQLNAEKARADVATAERDAAVEKLRQDRLETARNLRAMGLTVEQIVKAAGLSADEIERLA